MKFGVEVKEVTRKILPELDEEFAKTFKADSVDDLKAKIKEGLERADEQEAATKAKQEILVRMIGESLFEVPDGLVAMALESMMKSYREEFEARGEAGEGETESRLERNS